MDKFLYEFRRRFLRRMPSGHLLGFTITWGAFLLLLVGSVGVIDYLSRGPESATPAVFTGAFVALLVSGVVGHLWSCHRHRLEHPEHRRLIEEIQQL